jgi:flagellar protein FlbD
LIRLTRLNGKEFYLNPDLIETAESTPDTIISTVHGKKYVVLESVGEVAGRVAAFKGRVRSLALPVEEA